MNFLMLKCFNKLTTRTFKGLLFVGLIFTGFLLVGDFADAQNYRIHEQIPGQTGSGLGEDGVDTLQEYLEAAYKFGIAIVAILAVVMIGVGGFMYIVTSAGNAGKLANAKEIITSAILGLVMALLSWLILFVINPDLVGNTLKGVKLDMDSNAWKEDTEPDINACFLVDKELYEWGDCSGDYVCMQDTCRNKKSFCTLPGVKFPGVCSREDFVSLNVGDECGVVSSGQNLSGTCVAGVDCAKGSSEVVDGKQCMGEAICCSGAGGSTVDHYGRD
jgi:hypothetical protein